MLIIIMFKAISFERIIVGNEEVFLFANKKAINIAYFQIVIFSANNLSRFDEYCM